MAAVFPRVYILELNRNMIPEFSWWFLFGGCNGICWSIASIVFCLLHYLKKGQQPLKIDGCHECIRDTADPVNKANIPRFFYLFCTINCVFQVTVLDFYFITKFYFKTTPDFEIQQNHLFPNNTSKYILPLSILSKLNTLK